jgi:DNA (cytosine-5)-methyltransferase 1
VILDTFAGPGGGSLALRMLSPELHATELGIEWDKAACLTRRAAGHRTVRADVSTLVLEPMVGKVTGYIGSPPCQAWSKAGKGLGLKDQPRIFAHLALIERAGRWVDYPRDGWHDPRSPLVLEVLRAVLTLRPRWVACEQVPDVLGFWQACARLLRQHGYSATAFVLSAEEYGVPQTRQRAFLIASLDRRVSPPAPTHRAYDPRLGAASRYSDQASLFGDELLPWVSMADALGWGYEDRPSVTVMGGGTETGGAEPYGPRERRRLAALTYRNGNQANAAERTVDEPAPTVHFSERMNDVRWHFMGAGAGHTDGQQPRTPEQPAHTITGKGTAAWVHERPSTTVVGSFKPDVIAAPGYRTETSRQDAEGSVRVTVQQAAVLQSFPADYPWQGSKTAQHRQVGDAVPPLLGLHVLAAATGLPLPNAQEVAA